MDPLPHGLPLRFHSLDVPDPGGRSGGDALVDDLANSFVDTVTLGPLRRAFSGLRGRGRGAERAKVLVGGVEGVVHQVRPGARVGRAALSRAATSTTRATVQPALPLVLPPPSSRPPFAHKLLVTSASTGRTAARDRSADLERLDPRPRTLVLLGPAPLALLSPRLWPRRPFARESPDSHLVPRAIGHR